jgi:S1-C subfamily serine protease
MLQIREFWLAMVVVLAAGCLSAGFAWAHGEQLAPAAAESSPAEGEELPPPIIRRERHRIEVIRRVSPAVVAIFSPAGDAGGSGVLISSDGFVLTNFHVAYPCGVALKCGLPDGQLYDAVIVGWDPVGDIALLKLLGRDDFPFLPLGDSDQLAVGDEVLVLGNPFMLAMDLQPTVTFGIISGIQRYQQPAGTILEYTDCLQTDASINPGNSGGPLVDLAGRLVGINGRASFDRRGRVNVGLGYAISINQVKNFLPFLRGGRIVDHASLGAVVRDDSQGRPIVVEIMESSDAYRRGLRLGDEIVRFAGREIRSANDFKNVLGILPPGWRVPVMYRRQGDVAEIRVRLQRLHSEGELLEKIQGLKLEGEGPPSEPSPVPEALEKQLPSQPSLPEHLEQFFEARLGFANFYFNRLEQQRVLRQWAERQGTFPRKAAWILKSQGKDGMPVILEVGETGVRLTHGAQEFSWRFSGQEDLKELRSDAITGFFVSVFLWRKFVQEGSAGFGDTYYWGQEPYHGTEPLVDVIVTTFGPAECRWLFQEGLLIGMELVHEPGADCWEVGFDRFEPLESHTKVLLPRHLSAWVGDKWVAELNVTQFDLVPSKD